MKYIFFSLIFLNVERLCAQVDLNVILSLNENILFKGVSESKLLFENGNGVRDSAAVIYKPGSLKIDSLIFREIGRTDSKNVSLKFSYSDLIDGQLAAKKVYIIPLYTGSLEAGFIIFEIYDLSKKKYRKIFYSKEDYVWDINSDVYNARAVRRSKRLAKLL